jgi:hypothetical protein
LQFDTSELQIKHRELVAAKSRERLKAYSEKTGWDLDAAVSFNGNALPSLREILEDCIHQALDLPPVYGFMHGDLCFSNILYDSRSNSIKLIDPRGLADSDRSPVLGNMSYDVAKFTHSIVGLYDHIISGHYRLALDGTAFQFQLFVTEETLEVVQYFEQLSILGSLKVRDHLPLVITLFLSMLPLHSDQPQRQLAFIANALRLYLDLREGTAQ